MPKVSIIIPFNNVENYIEQCLDSVLNQTLTDIEVILVNDYSTDKSSEIVKKYIERDSRIKLLTLEERKGQGFARNRAIEIATGEYIGFVDSDDFIEPNMFEELYNKAKSDDTDITMCQVREYDDLNEKYISSDYYALEPLASFGENTFSAEDTKEQILDINVALWNKLYKKDYLIGIGEKFPEGFIYEDLPFFFGTYLPAKKINIVWKNLYSYRVNRKNSTMQQFNNKILDRLPMVSLTYEKIKAFPFINDIKQKVQGWIINDIFHRYTLLKENYHKEYFFLMKKIFENLEIENVEDDYWKRVYHFEGYLLVLNNSFEVFNQKVFNEYLDIHEIENRILSQVVDSGELDRRFGLVYSDFSKVYQYVEQTSSSLQNKICDDISKNYDYTNKLVDDLSNNFRLKTDEDIRAVSSQTDEKISKIYDEITKNYKYTEELTGYLSNEIAKNQEHTNKVNDDLKQELQDKYKALYGDVKDISFVVQDNFVQSNKVQSEILEEYKSFKEETNQYKKQSEDQISYINKEIEKQSVSLDKTVDNVNLKISNLKKEFEIEKQGYLEIIENLKTEYKSLLKEQEINHKQEIIELQGQIKELEYNLREEMKSPIKKLIEKYKNK